MYSTRQLAQRGERGDRTKVTIKNKHERNHHPEKQEDGHHSLGKIMLDDLPARRHRYGYGVRAGESCEKNNRGTAIANMLSKLNPKHPRRASNQDRTALARCNGKFQ